MSEVEFIKSFLAIGGVPVIVGLVQLAKQYIPDHRWLPLVALILGLIINIFGTWAMGITANTQWVSAVFNGIIAGMAASGFYSAGAEIKRNDGGQ